MFRKKKKKQEKQKAAQQSPPASPPADQTENAYDKWIDHTKPQGAQAPTVEDTYDEWIDDGKASSKSKLPPVEDAYDNWVDDAPSPAKPKVEDEYYNCGTTEDVGNQEYEQVEGEGDIFGFDNKKGSSKHSATSPSWVNKPPPVKGTPPSARKVISPQPPQDGDNLEYEDVVGEGDIFGFDNKKGSFKNTTSPSWANKVPPVKGPPPSAKRPISMQPPPNLPKSLPPSQRPKSMQSPTYNNVPQSKGSDIQEAVYIIPNSPEEYEVPLSQANTVQQEGESYEEMDDLDLKPSYVNVPCQDVGGESYEEMDDLDLKNTTPTSPAAGVTVNDFYDDVLPDDHATKKPVITTSIAERQQQLQKKEIKEPPKKKGLAADYQKMKFEMLAQKFKEIDAGEAKSEPTMAADKKKATWPPKNSAADEGTPAKGTVTSLTRGFQPNMVTKPKEKAIKGLLWHKAPGRNKYSEEHCELEGTSLKIFRSKNDPKPYFTINTAQCELAAAPEEYEKKNVFKLTAGASRDYFGAFNAGEMKAWMNALRPVVKSAK